jgi:N-acetylglucosaminyldiphosphoundecaprenol N-acetyl-beta-D-mannosaminyltransferase
MTKSLEVSRALTLTVTEAQTLFAGHELYRGDDASLIVEFERLIRLRGRHLIITPNVDQILTLRTSEQARRVFARASLRLVDGAPLLLLARLLGDRLLHRLTGADLLVSVCEASSSRGWKVVIAGGDETVSSAAVARLSERFPGADVVSVPFPRLRSAEDARGRDVVEQLVALAPQLVFLCLGFPKQEAWYLRWEHELPDAIYVGAGAAVDFAAGMRRRAPRSVQRLGVEWIWRLAQEPRRLASRYLLKGPGFVRVIAESVGVGLRQRRRGAAR